MNLSRASSNLTQSDHSELFYIDIKKLYSELAVIDTHEFSLSEEISKQASYRHYLGRYNEVWRYNKTSTRLMFRAPALEHVPLNIGHKAYSDVRGPPQSSHI